MKKINKKSILILCDQPLNERNYSRFGIEYLVKKKWNIFFYSNYNYTLKFKNLKFVKNNNMFETISNLKKISNKTDFYFNFTGNNIRDKILEFYCKKFRIKKINFTIGNIPITKKVVRKILFKNLFKYPILTILFAIENIKNFFLGKFFTIKPDLHLYAGKKDIKTGKINISNHNFDYDDFLKIRKKLKIRKLNNVVFIDQNYEDSFDLNKSCHYFKYEKNKYWHPINLFFKNLKNTIKCNIKALPHPRRKKWDNKFLLKSNENNWKLISKAKIIFAHDSTAIQIAVLLKKPIILLTSNYIEKDLYRKLSIETFSNQLDLQIINVDKIESIKKLNTRVNKKKYDQYINNFIKEKESSDKITWCMLEKYFLSIYKD